MLNPGKGIQIYDCPFKNDINNHTSSYDRPADLYVELVPSRESFGDNRAIYLSTYSIESWTANQFPQ